MEYIFVGEIINTHGIKGELRIISDFKYKEEIFVNGFYLYVGHFKDKLKIIKHRQHKIYDMLTFEGLTNINDVLIYKGDNIYIKKEDLKIEGLFNEQLIGLTVYYQNKLIGIVEKIVNNKAHDILVIKGNKEKYLVPNLDNFIESINVEESSITLKKLKGLIYED